MAGSGPPREPESRRGRREGRRLLPAQGRRGRAPSWPSGLSAPSKAELALWRELWRSPQAAAWEELGCHRTVARFVAFSAALAVPGEEMSATALKTYATEVRLLEDRLGLSPLSMRHLGWEIAATVTSHVVTGSVETQVSSSRADALRVIRGGDGAA